MNKFIIKTQNLNRRDPDILPLEEEKRLLLKALQDVYPHLPNNLQSIVYKVPYFVNHEWTAVTKTYMGWSAEDDPEYLPGDQKFYNPELSKDDPENGTIKVVVTQKFIKTLAITEVLGKEDPEVLLAGKLFARALLAHELLHAWQYYTKPVKALTTVENKGNTSNEINCPDGLCNKELLEEHKKKIEYERDAAELERNYIDSQLFFKFANALDQYEAENPDFFIEGGKWHILSGKCPSPLNEYYFREKARTQHLAREFDNLAKATYEGQIIPPQLVYDLKEVNDSLEKKVISKEVAKKQFDTILDKWKEFCELNSTQLLKRIVEPLPYLKLVNKRFNLELKRFDKLK